MSIKIFIFQIILLSGFIANAGICSFLLTKSPLRKLTESYKLKEIAKTAQSNEGKLEKAGTILRSSKEIHDYLYNSPANDNFPFVISSKGKLIISPRLTAHSLTPEYSGAIAAHRSLLNKLQASDSIDFPVAAGELRKRNNQIYMISNKSGMLRGEELTLDLIKDYFSEVKIQNHDLIEFRNYSKNEYVGDHVSDLQYGKNAFELNSDKSSREIVANIQNLYHEYYQIFPNEQKPGHVDLMKLFEAVSEFSSEHYLSVVGNLNVISDEGFYLYSTKEKNQEIEFSLQFVLKKLREIQ